MTNVHITVYCRQLNPGSTFVTVKRLNISNDTFRVLHNTNFIPLSVVSSLADLTYSNPITGLDRPLGFREVEAPRFLDNRHLKVVRLSALHT
jgi:hypothetical protein